MKCKLSDEMEKHNSFARKVIIVLNICNVKHNSQYTMVDVLTSKKHLRTTKHKSPLEIAASPSSSSQLKKEM
jgi:hypothetical protein